MSSKGYKETEIGLIPEDWEIKKIGDICQQVRNSFNPNDNDIRPYIGLEHINEGSLTLNGVGSSSEVKSGKLVFQNGQILFGKLRPYFRKVYRPDFDGVCSTDILVIDKKEDNDNRFIFYFFANPLIIDIATQSSEGTKMPRASWNYLIDLEFPFPDFNEQKAIGKFLSSIDQKIYLNHQMNQTLEAIGQAIFRHWFVHFEFPNSEGQPYKSSGGEMVDSELGEIPKGWEIGKLGDLISITSGKRPKEKSEKQTIDFKIPLIGASSLMGYVKETLYNKPILVIGRVGTHGIIQKITPPSYPSDNTLVITSKYYEFVYQILRRIDYDSLNVGTTQPLITQKSIKNQEIIIPSQKILFTHENIISSLSIKMMENNSENEYLSKIRDYLLPKLMSGKIRVNIPEEATVK